MPDTDPGGKHPKVKVRVIGGPWGKPIKVPNPKTKRGWSISQAYWVMHGYTKTTLPQVQWIGATRYNLTIVGDTPFYVYDPQVKLCQRILNYRGRGQAISLGSRPR